jgi:hypothetical protein
MHLSICPTTHLKTASLPENPTLVTTIYAKKSVSWADCEYSLEKSRFQPLFRSGLGRMESGNVFRLNHGRIRMFHQAI